jgi:hypothetical protein
MIASDAHDYQKGSPLFTGDASIALLKAIDGVY